MIYIGNHLSASDGYLAMAEKETQLGGSTFAFFTRNPRGGQAKKLDPADMEACLAFLQAHSFGPLVAHAPYTMNLCSSKENIRTFSLDMLTDDLQRMEYLPGQYYNFHPGSATGQSEETAIEQIADALNTAMFSDMKTTVLLETMAGKGSEIGRNFSQLRRIIDRVSPELCDHLGVCLDTCHVWDGGYDIVESLDDVLEQFDEQIGIGRLRAIHINDSKNPRESHKDRHEKIGEGQIGTEALRRVVTHPLLQDKPFILETPNDDAGYAAEISLIRSWMI